METSEIASHVVVDSQRLVELPVPVVEPLLGLLLTPVAQILAGFNRLRLDPGWNGVVVGSGFRADLLLLLAHLAGARHLTAVRSGELLGIASHLPSTHLDPVLAGWQQTLADHLERRPGSVIAFDTTGTGSMVNSVLATLPERSQMALFGQSRGDEVSVDFYRDVHRKNVTLVGMEAGFPSEMISRAHSMISRRLLSHVEPTVRNFEAVEGLTLDARSPGLAVISWLSRPGLDPGR